MYQDYFWVLAFMAISLAFAGVATIIPEFLAPRSKGRDRSSTYESGVPTIGTAWIPFNVLYYLYALVFLVFDVDVTLLFPVAVAYRDIPGLGVFWSLLAFVVILALALVYVIRKGVFQWK